MAPKQVSIEAYSSDTVDFIQCLDRHGVKFMIAGGEAVIFHGYPRFTEGIDFFFSTDTENLKALIRNKVASGRLKDQLDAEYLSQQDEEN